jgi:hypothetical protein
VKCPGQMADDYDVPDRFDDPEGNLHAPVPAQFHEILVEIADRERIDLLAIHIQDNIINRTNVCVFILIG